MKPRVLAIFLLSLTAAAGVRAEDPAPAKPPEPVVRTTQPAAHWFGVAVEALPAAISQLLKLQPGQGLLIDRVIPNTPAEKAGLQAGDLIIRINGQPLLRKTQLLEAADRTDAAGASLPSTLDLIRNGDPTTVVIRPVPRPAAMAMVQVQGRQEVTATTEPVQRVTFNGKVMDIGPGVVLDAQGSTASIRQLVQNGHVITVTQRTGSDGKQSTTIAVGDTNYAVTPETLETLPPELRDLARTLLPAPANEPATRP